MDSKMVVLISVLGTVVVLAIVAAIAVGGTLAGERAHEVRIACIEQGGIPGKGERVPPCYYGKEGTTP